MALLDFINVVTIFWLILGLSVIHVLEEYFGGFVDMMKKMSPMRGMTTRMFVLVNSIFIALCVLAAVINSAIPVYSLSISALILVNAFIHIGGALRERGYAPGLISAVLFYIPLSVYSYLLYSQAGLLDPSVLALSMILGFVWMALALLYALASSRKGKDSERASSRQGSMKLRIHLDI